MYNTLNIDFYFLFSVSYSIGSNLLQLEWEKMEMHYHFTDSNQSVKRGKFYRLLTYVEKAIDLIWEEEQKRILGIIIERYKSNTLGVLYVAIDAAWHKRGHTSEYGNFAAVLVSHHEDLNNKVHRESII